MKLCRNCRSQLTRTFVDLGHTPLANSYLTKEQLDEPETWYPLHAYVCENCLMVQLGHNVDPTTVFTQYDYWSSTSPTWVQHAKEYADKMTEKLQLNGKSLVVEIGSNDGYLLKHFKNNGVNVYGFEPAKNIAEAAKLSGVPTIDRFFCRREAALCAWNSADLICGTNVFAHVPDIHDLVEGIHVLLKAEGTCTMEFPWLKNLVEQCQFDTIYHEHYSYFSLSVVCLLFNRHGMSVYHVDRLPTHGGSIRIHACHQGAFAPDETVSEMLREEEDCGMWNLDWYTAFNSRCQKARESIRMQFACWPNTTVGYGAPAKASTLLNFCGISKDRLAFIVDDSPAKQGKFMPGSHIPIVPKGRLMDAEPDTVAILAWNLADAIKKANPEVEQFGRWVTVNP